MMHRPMKRRNCRRHKQEGDEESKTSLGCLPPDIAKDILSRLPIRSIVQTRLVCKSWELLSRDPHVFHMHISRSPGSKLLFFHRHYMGNELSFIEFSDIDENGLIVSKIENLFGDYSLPDLFMVTASRNGLVCFEEYEEFDNWICICSPFTRDYKFIPKVDSKYSASTYGFGCHPITREYKLVRIGYYDDEDKSYNIRTAVATPRDTEVQVYSLTRNEWRSIGALPDEQMDPVTSEAGVLLGGRLHWLTKWPSWYLNSCPGLIYFDLADDSLGNVPLPTEFILKTNSETRWRALLVVLGGCLSIAVANCKYPTEWMQIWMMKVYGVKDSWVKQYSLSGDGIRELHPSWESWHNSSLVKILCLLDNGEILLEYNGEILVSYNCDTKIFKKVTFGGTSPKSVFMTTLMLHTS